MTGRGLDAGGTMLLAGCGTMAGAMLRRWLDCGLDPSRVTALRPSGRAVVDGVRVVTTPPAEPPALLMLGVKPQKLDEAAPGLEPLAGPGTLLVSILAGVELAELRRRFPRARALVRAMPNTPVALGRGVVALCGEDEAAVAEVAALMRPLGLVERIADERLFDALTALAGSGPAFLFRFVDALGRAGAALGLPRDQAARLALATVDGAARLAAVAEETPAALAERVASPGGSTRAGLTVLDREDGLAALLAETLRAAERRNRELGGARPA